MATIIDIETSGLNSILDRITCISTLDLKTNLIQSFCGCSEKEILSDFWLNFDSSKTFVTYNGDSFDIPYIIKRSIILGVKIKKLPEKIIDLRKAVNSFYIGYNKYEKGTLCDWSKILGLGEKKTNGKEVVEMFLKGDWEGIRKHCEEDVKLTKALYDRCIEVNLIEDCF